MFCYLVYSDLPSKYTKLEENFGGFMNRSLVRFEFEKSLHTIVYGATGTGKTYFVKHYLKLYLDEEQYQDNNDMIEGPLVLAPQQKQKQGQEQKRMVKHGRRSMVEHGEASAKPFHGWTKSHDRRSIGEPASQMAEHDRMSIIVVCKDKRDWIDPETGEPSAGFDMGDINMITMKNILKFKNSVIVLDDMGDKFNKDVVIYFTEGRNKNIQMILMCQNSSGR